MIPANSLDQSPEVILRVMVEQVTTRVAGCCGCSAELRLDAEPMIGVCSHPDLAELGAGLDPTASPVMSAAQTLEPVGIGDCLSDTVWPDFSALALRRGIRSVYTAAHPVYDGVLTSTLYSLRPGGLAADAPATVALLLQEWSDTLVRTAAYAVVRSEAHHLGEAIAAKEVIEQAKGMLMQALKCDGATAYAELQNSAKRARVRTVEMARRMIEHGGIGTRPEPGERVPPAASSARRRPPTSTAAV